MSTPPVRAAARLVTSPVLLAGALVAAAVVGLAFLGIGGGDTSPRTVTARFQDVSGLVVGNEVRVAGVEAGQVKSIEVRTDASQKRQYAEVTFQVDSAHWPLHQGTRVAVRPKGVLSNVFVDLRPGSGQTLDQRHVFDFAGSNPETESPINLDELSNTFDPNFTTALRTQIDEGNVILSAGGAQKVNDLIHTLNPLTADLRPVTTALAERSPELSRLNNEYNVITTELAAEDANLRGLVNNGSVLLGAIAARQDALEGTLDHASSTLGTLDAALNGEEGKLATFFQLGPQALDKLRASSGLLTPLVAQVNPHVPSLNVLLEQFTTTFGYKANGIFNLRANAFLAPAGAGFSCGGEPSEQPCAGGGAGAATPQVAPNGPSSSSPNAQPGTPNAPASPTGQPPQIPSSLGGTVFR